MLRFMAYSKEQLKNPSLVKVEYLISKSIEENLCNLWKVSDESKGTISTPLINLELISSDQILGIEIKQIAEHYYFAIYITSQYVWGYVLNLKTKAKDGSLWRKHNFKVTLDDEFIQKNVLIESAYIKNEYELIVIQRNWETINIHSIIYLNDDGKSTGNDLLIKWTQKLTKANGISPNKLNKESSNNIYPKGILEGIDLNSLKSNVSKLFLPDDFLQNESLVSTLEEHLQSNDIEGVNTVISVTDTSLINETVDKLTKNSLYQFMPSLLLSLQQKSNKGALLWLSSILKQRWIDVITFVGKSSIHSKTVLAPLFSHLNCKTKNISKYYETKAKIEMVIEWASTPEDNMDLDEEQAFQSSADHKMQEDEKSEDNEEQSNDEVIEDFEQVQLHSSLCQWSILPKIRYQILFFL